MRARIFPTFFLFLLLASLSCSRFAVYFIEQRIVSRADDNFDLNEIQKPWVKERVSFHLLAMRSQFIPEFIKVIDQGLAAYQDSLTEEEVFITIDALRDAFRPYLKQIMVDFSTFYGMLEPQQWERYQKKKMERDAERREKEERRKAKEDPFEKILDRYEELYGSLKDEQKQLIKKMYLDDPASFAEDSRINFDSTLFAQSLSEIIKADLKSEDKIKAMQDLFRDPEKVLEAVNYDGTFQRMKENQRKLVRIDGSMDAKQRQHFIKKWQEIRDTFKSFIP